MSLSSTIDALLALGPDGQHPAGAAVGVRQDGHTQIATGGWAALPTGDIPGVPVTDDTLFDLASITKVAATTTLAMRLVADDRLDLTQEVRPGVTVEHLLTHTSGMRAWWPLYCGDAPDDLVHDPGTTWVYSDLGLIRLGRLIEEITGVSLREAYTSLVTEPLGIADLGYGPVDAERAATSADSDAYELTMMATGQPHAGIPFTADDFSGWRSAPARGVVNDGNCAHALGGASGHAGLFGTMPALLELGHALRTGFVPADVLARFAQPSSVEPIQALGFRRRTAVVDGDHVDLLWHGGFTGTFFAFALDRDLVIAGAATRLHGVTGPLPDPYPKPGDPLIPAVANDEIQQTILDGVAAL